MDDLLALLISRGFERVSIERGCDAIGDYYRLRAFPDRKGRELGLKRYWSRDVPESRLFEQAEFLREARELRP